MCPDEQPKKDIVEIPAGGSAPKETSEKEDFEIRQEPTKMQERYLKYRKEGLNKKDAAEKAGYAPSTANNVKDKIENTDGFRKLIELEMPDKFLATEHKRLIKQDEDKSVKGKMIVEAYKLKGKYPKGEIDVNAPNVILHFNKQEE